MSFRLATILTLLLACVPTVHARTVEARIARVVTPVATLHDVRISLDWPADAAQGRLRLRAGQVDSGELGWRFDDVDWQCPLQRAPGGDGPPRWRCDGEVRGAGGGPLRLAIALDAARTDARLSAAGASLSLARDAGSPERTRIDLRQVPAAWAEALVRQHWSAAQLRGGRLDGSVRIDSRPRQPLRIGADLALRELAIESDDGQVASDRLGADLRMDLQLPGAGMQLRLDGVLRGGDVLLGQAFVALPGSPIGIGLDLVREDAAGWHVSRLLWDDGATLHVAGQARLTPALELAGLELALASRDASAVPERYLSGWLGLAGLSGLSLRGGLDASLAMSGGSLREADLRLRRLDIGDADARFRLDGLGGAIRYSVDTPVRSTFGWRGGALYGMPFDAAAWPLRSGDGQLRLRDPVALSFLGGRLGFDALALQPPSGGQGLRLQTGLRLEQLDIGLLAQALDWPAFEGRVEGRIPTVRYGDNRIEFDGGLTMALFDGQVAVSSLSIERPFGVAPTVASDLAIDGLDLHALTGVFGFGSIEGRLDGRIDGLRLIDWTPTAFDAALRTRAHRGVRQRISQRAVQNISSVGDASFVTSLQGRLIGLFDDFGYRAIGISCRLRNEVCRMGGLREGADSFAIVQGAGLPRLDVVGHNRDVDWPTLVERLAAVAGGEVEPVFD